MILWGPPGTGKTTLARLLAAQKERPFYQLSAIDSGVKEIREILKKAQPNGGLFTNKSPLLFIDEIHTVIGAGATSGGAMDASNLLKPSLQSGTPE